MLFDSNGQGSDEVSVILNFELFRKELFNNHTHIQQNFLNTFWKQVRESVGAHSILLPSSTFWMVCQVRGVSTASSFGSLSVSLNGIYRSVHDRLLHRETSIESNSAALFVEEQISLCQTIFISFPFKWFWSPLPFEL